MSAITNKIDFIDAPFINGLTEHFTSKTVSEFKDLINCSQQDLERWRTLFLNQPSSQERLSIKGDVKSGIVRLSNQARFSLFVTQFAKKLSIKRFDSSLRQESPYPYEITIWRPKTEPIPKSASLANYDKNSLKFFEEADRGEGTDITLESQEGARVAFHSLFLRRYTHHFGMGLENPAEGESSHNFPMHSFSTQSLQNLQLFIYLRCLSEATTENIDELIELFDLAETTAIKKLQKEMIGWISDFKGTLKACDIWRILDRAEKFNIETFHKTCVVAAEKLEHLESEEKCDWSSFRLLWTDLFVLAQDEQAPITQGRLQALIDQLIGGDIKTHPESESPCSSPPHESVNNSMSIGEIDFFDPQFQKVLRQYCVAYVNAREYSEVEEKTKKLYAGWLHELEESQNFEATLSQTTYIIRKSDGTCYPATYYLDSLAFFILQSNFEKKLGIKCESVHFNDRGRVESHAFGYEFGKSGDAYPYSFRCKWEPDHPLLGKPLKMNAYLPDENSLRFLEMAKKGEETDLILKSGSGDKVRLHSIFLTTCSDVFKRALQMPLKDSQKRHFTLKTFSTSALENLREFLYTRQITEESRANFDELLELLALSHEKGIELLESYAVGLIDQVLSSPAPLSGDQLTQLIHKAFLFEKPHFYQPCIRRAEKLEEEKAESLVDWSGFHLAWTKLIIISKKSKATLTTLKLIKLTKKFIARTHQWGSINSEAGPSSPPQDTI